ncbi:membrane protein insertase YidC [Peribacillus alkalitolerans]|uniref:membrane protein insertase YidC n=1 Tax=Peribacillus alkalitolerans TaxID=1550385 RepID=UPI0013D621C5|nr:membrane protein insertase YidC [Peribacillus alkalitolerans]
MDQKTKKTGYLLLFITLLLVVLTGCQQTSTTTIEASTPGFFNHYFVYSFSVVLKTIAYWFNGNYGLSIILVTLLVRLLLMPIMLRQTKSQVVMKEKMKGVQPELSVVQEKLKKAKTTEDKAKYQAELMAVYKKNNINPLAAMGGCLPLLLQMPILMGFYYAIRRTPEIASHSFLWFNLGHTDHILPFVAGLVYLLQFRISLGNLPEEQKKQMAVMGMLSPIMMTIFSFSAPAALPLYWTIGGLFLILQTYLGQKLYQNTAVLEQKSM